MIWWILINLNRRALIRLIRRVCCFLISRRWWLWIWWVWTSYIWWAWNCQILWTSRSLSRLSRWTRCLIYYLYWAGNIGLILNSAVHRQRNGLVSSPNFWIVSLEWNQIASKRNLRSWICTEYSVCYTK